MSDERRKRGGFWLAMVLLLGMYVGGYFVASKVESTEPSTINRYFGSASMARFYTPLGWIECKVSDKDVNLCRPLRHLPGDTPDYGAIIVEFIPRRFSK